MFYALFYSVNYLSLGHFMAEQEIDHTELMKLRAKRLPVTVLWSHRGNLIGEQLCEAIVAATLGETQFH